MDDTSVRIISMNEPLSLQNAAVGRVKTFQQEFISGSNSQLHSSSRVNLDNQWHQTSYNQIKINEIVDFDIQNKRQFSQANAVN